MNDIGVDTHDLNDDNCFDFEVLKKNYLNNMISWSFLKKISEFNQWPLACIVSFLENSFKKEVCACNVFIDVKCYDKKVYMRENDYSSEILTNSIDTINKTIVLSIKDDGKGISTREFNQIMYSFSVNEKKEFNFLKYGVSLKASAIRIANSLLFISKTESEISVGMISKNLQSKLDTDFILTPVINFYIDYFKEGRNKYIPKSNFSQQSLSLILNEIKFIYPNSEVFFDYIDSFTTGTHIMLYDLKQISSNKADINKLNNYELLFDFEEKDIIYNYFDLQIGERSYIDSSLVNYIKFLYLEPPEINLFIFGISIDMRNPMKDIYYKFKSSNTISKINSNFKIIEDHTKDALVFVGDIYKGVLYNRNYSIEFEKVLYNGILLYRNNRLISRFEQSKLGDISFFVKKYLKHNNLEGIFDISGYVELPISFFDVLFNNSVI